MDFLEGPTGHKNDYSIHPRKTRGRPSQWSESYLRMMIILRLCGLLLGEIIELLVVLSGGKFQPKTRTAQVRLQEALSDGYARYCTSRSQALRQRVQYIKRVKGKRKNVAMRHQLSASAILNKSEPETKSYVNDTLLAEIDDLVDYSLNENEWWNYEATKNQNDAPKSSKTRVVPGRGDRSQRTTDEPIQADLHNAIVPSIGTLSRSCEADGGLSQLQPLAATSLRTNTDVREILRRGSRSSSCISEIASLLSRFSMNGSGTSIHQVKQSSSTLNFDAPELPSDIGLPKLLAGHFRKVHLANADTLAKCCAQHSSQDCIHRLMLSAITSRKKSQPRLHILPSALGSSPYMDLDCYGNNALFFAARSGAPPDLLFEIIDRTPDLNLVNDDGQNFLFVLDTIEFGPDFGVFRELIGKLDARGFNFDHKDHHGRHFLTLYCLRSKFPLDWITQLCRFDEVWSRRMKDMAHYRDSSGVYMIDHLSDRRDIVSLPLDTFVTLSKPEKPPYENASGQTFFHELVLSQYGINRHSQQVKLHPFPFLGPRKQVENVNRYNREGYTPLLFFVRAALAEQPRESEAFINSHVTNLITLGASVNSRARNGESALHWAAQQRMPEVMECLIRAGANVNAIDDSGQRPIDYVTRILQQELATSATANTSGQTLKCAVVLLDHDAETGISSQIEGSHGIRLDGKNVATLTIAGKTNLA